MSLILPKNNQQAHVKLSHLTAVYPLQGLLLFLLRQTFLKIRDNNHPNDIYSDRPAQSNYDSLDGPRVSVCVYEVSVANHKMRFVPP